jgi:hypothetical protein
MDDFQKQLQRLKRNPVFAKAFDKRRTEAEVAFQIRRLRESEGWSQKGFSQEGRLQPPGGISGRTSRLQTAFSTFTSSHRRRLRRRRCRRFGSTQSRVEYLCKTAEHGRRRAERAAFGQKT